MGEVRARVTFEGPMAAGRDRKRLSQKMRERILAMVSQNQQVAISASAGALSRGDCLTI
jgi:hypothetical protein